MTALSDAALARLAEVAASPEEPGARYELGELLGRGGMGAVYRAFDHALQRDVALKVLELPAEEPPAAGHAERARRLLREARVLARLEHPGIVPVHDSGRLPDGRVFCAMKLVRGRRLDEERQAGRPLVELLRVFERVCEAVAFAHARGVLHRDLKPQNVMVGAFGEVLVMDWGVARWPRLDPNLPAAEAPPAGAPATAADRAEPAVRTACGTVVGTPGYMAPEQARGETDTLDARADVYALGALLHFLLTGRPPGAAAAASSQMRTRTWPDLRPEGERAGPRVALMGPEVPAALAAVVRRALAVDPAARYPDAAELGAEVRRFLAGERVSAHRERLWQRAVRLAGRHRVALLLLASYLAMRLALFFFAGT